MSDDYPIFQPKQGQVLALIIDGTNDACGFAAACGCTPNVSKIPKQYHVPQEASSLIDLEDLNVFINEVNHILETTYIPALPISFLHFCIPFSPVCIFRYCQSQRQEALNELLKVKNAAMKDAHWELNPKSFHYPLHPLISLISHSYVEAVCSPTAVAVVIADEPSAPIALFHKT